MDSREQIRKNLERSLNIKDKTRLTQEAALTAHLQDPILADIGVPSPTDQPIRVEEVLIFRVKVNGVVQTRKVPWVHFIKVDENTGKLIEGAPIRAARKLAAQDIVSDIDLNRLIEKESLVSFERRREAAVFNATDFGRAIRERLTIDGISKAQINGIANTRVQTYAMPLQRDLTSWQEATKTGRKSNEIFGAPFREVDGLSRPLPISPDLTSTVYFGKNPVTGNRMLNIQATHAGAYAWDTDGDAMKALRLWMRNELTGKSSSKIILANNPQTGHAMVAELEPLSKFNWRERYSLAENKLAVQKNLDALQDNILKSYKLSQERDLNLHPETFTDRLSGYLVDPQIGLLSDALSARRALLINQKGWRSEHLVLDEQYRDLEGALKMISKGLRGKDVNINNAIPKHILDVLSPKLNPIAASLALNKSLYDKKGNLKIPFETLAALERAQAAMTPAERMAELRSWQTGHIFEQLNQEDLFLTNEEGELVQRPINIKSVNRRFKPQKVKVNNPFLNPIANNGQESILTGTRIDVKQFRRAGLENMPLPVLLERRDLSGKKHNYLSTLDERGVGRGLVILPEWRTNLETGKGEWIDPYQIIKEVSQKEWDKGEHKWIRHSPIGNSSQRRFMETSDDFNFTQLFEKHQGQLRIKSSADIVMGQFAEQLGMSPEDLVNDLMRGATDARKEARFNNLVIEHDLLAAKKDYGFDTAFKEAIYGRGVEGNVLYKENEFGRAVPIFSEDFLKELAHRLTIGINGYESATPAIGFIASQQAMAEVGMSPNAKAYSTLKEGGYMPGHITAGPNTIGLPKEQGLGIDPKRYAKNARPLLNGARWQGESAIFFNSEELEAVRPFISADFGIQNPNENTAFITREGFEKHLDTVFNNRFLTPYNSAKPTDVHTVPYDTVNNTTGRKEIRWTFARDRIKEIFTGGPKVIIAGEKVSPTGVESIHLSSDPGVKIDFAHVADQLASRGDLLDKLNLAADFYGLGHFPGDKTAIAQANWIKAVVNKAELFDILYQKEGVGTQAKIYGLRIGKQEISSNNEIIDLTEGSDTEMLVGSGAAADVADTMAKTADEMQENIGLDSAVKIRNQNLLKTFKEDTNPIRAFAQREEAQKNIIAAETVMNEIRGVSEKEVQKVWVSILGRLSGGIR